MFSLADLLLVVLYMLKALIRLAGAAACLAWVTRVAVLLIRSVPWTATRNRRLN